MKWFKAIVILSLTLGAFLFFVFTHVVSADTTVVLRPISDGGDDSVDWKNTVGTTCNNADCYLEIDESSGAACTNSDGDISYIEGKLNGVNQTFDIDESSIPDNATITQIDITVCYKRKSPGGGQQNDFQTRRCTDGACNNSGADITTASDYTETTQSHTGLSIVKAASTDIEIGVTITGTTNKEARISQISAIITYTSPADTTAPSTVTDLATSNAATNSVDLTWTAPGDDGDAGTATSYDIRYSTSIIDDSNWDSATQVAGEPAPLVAGSGESMTVSGLSADTTYYFALKVLDEVSNESSLSNIPNLSTLQGEESPPPPPPPPSSGGGRAIDYTRAIFSGLAYSSGTIEIFRRNRLDSPSESIPLTISTIAADGSFYIVLENLLYGDYIFTLEAVDKDGRKSGILGFSVDFLFDDASLSAEDIFVPPTVSVSEIAVTQGEDLKIVGYASPNSTVELEIDGTINGETKSDETGFYVFSTSTARLSFGEHFVRVWQIDQSGRASNLSPSKVFKVSSLELPKADFNNDNIINITDWSIFLFRWGSEEKDLRLKIDLDNNDVIDIFDFSIFLDVMRI